jgi:hypothetical protein
MENNNMKGYAVIYYFIKKQGCSLENNLMKKNDLASEIKKLKKKEFCSNNHIFLTRKAARKKVFQLLALAFTIFFKEYFRLEVDKNHRIKFDCYVALVSFELLYKNWNKLTSKNIRKVEFYRACFNAGIKNKAIDEISIFPLRKSMHWFYRNDIIDTYWFGRNEIINKCAEISLKNPVKILHNKSFYKYEQRLRNLLYFIYCCATSKKNFPLDVLHVIAKFYLHRDNKERNHLIKNLIKSENVKRLIKFFCESKKTKRSGFIIIIQHSNGKFALTFLEQVKKHTNKRKYIGRINEGNQKKHKNFLCNIL